MSEEKEHPLIQTYLRDLAFNVSTAYRQSSAMLAPDLWYYETLIWKWDEATRDRTDLIYSESSGISKESAYANHCLLVEKLIKGESLEENE